MRNILILSIFLLGCNTNDSASNSKEVDTNSDTISIENLPEISLNTSYSINGNFTWGPPSLEIGQEATRTNDNFGITEEIINGNKHVKLYDAFNQLVHFQSYVNDSLVDDYGQYFTYWFKNYNSSNHTVDIYIASIDLENRFRNLGIFKYDTTGGKHYEHMQSYLIKSNKDTITIQLDKSTKIHDIQPSLIYLYSDSIGDIEEIIDKRIDGNPVVINADYE